MTGGADPFIDELSTALPRLGVVLPTPRLSLLKKHFELVVEANRSMNLTRITDPSEAAIKHYADSLALLPWSQSQNMTVQTVLDVGTGAGFPSVPLAIAEPNWSIMAIDSTLKKIEFVQHAAIRLELSGLSAVHQHSVHWTADRTFDLVVFRALRRLPRAILETAKWVAPGGWLVAFKTAVLDDSELNEAVREADRFGLQSFEPYEYTLRLGDETIRRSLQLFQRGL